ncbi:hypothetical protein RHSIM_Rhsim07G0203900 [Rhododendron simsii]|uniref:Uncharacterized protein n=1 Tax=Rhododendron simsii TaxID=118357 RepID=A0A834GN82_RHOSS|nr:hypothetical protein RHSIM_Rhsim07G0203900 [Rhododendron simsii]
MHGPQTLPLVAPNGNVWVDGMVINLATVLAGMVTDPFDSGYFQGPATAPLEAVSACTGIFGSGAYPEYTGSVLTDKTTGSSYNAQGVNGRRPLSLVAAPGARVVGALLEVNVTDERFGSVGDDGSMVVNLTWDDPVKSSKDEGGLFGCHRSIAKAMAADLVFRAFDPSSVLLILFALPDPSFATTRKLAALFQQQPLVLNYHNGPLLKGTVTVNLIWYGSFSPVQRSIIADFIQSMSSADAPPSVASWWQTIENYKDGSSNLVLGTQVLDENCSLGKSLTASQIVDLASKAPTKGSINVVCTAVDVVVDKFCMSNCGTHGSGSTDPKDAQSKFAYAWVGNPMTQCPGQCAWPFHKPTFGPQTPPLVAPNGDVGVDGMVINLATVLAGTVTDPFNNGYFQGPATAPLEAVSACTGIFGSGAYPGYAGSVLTDKATGASYNAQGVNRRKYLLPAIGGSIYFHRVTTYHHRPTALMDSFLAALSAPPSGANIFSATHCLGSTTRKLAALFQQQPLVLNYHNGPLLKGTVAINLIWYGSFSPVQRSIIADFIQSMNSTDAPPSVTSWWQTIENYKDGSSNIVLGAQILDENCSLGKSLTTSQIVDLASKASTKGSINVVCTAADVVVDGFCMSNCGTHGSGLADPKDAQSKFAYAWVGNPMTQCPGQCAWPFHKPMFGPQTPPLVAPNGDVGVDGMVINLATVLAGTVTDPFDNGYFQGPATAPLEAVSACTGIFGSGAYPGYAGSVLTDKATGGSYNAQGVNGRKYLLPAMWDPKTSTCKTLV